MSQTKHNGVPVQLDEKERFFLTFEDIETGVRNRYMNGSAFDSEAGALDEFRKIKKETKSLIDRGYPNRRIRWKLESTDKTKKPTQLNIRD